MHSKPLGGSDEKTFLLVFDIGDETIQGLTRFAQENKITAAHFTGIGGFSKVVLGYFDWEKKTYAPIPVEEQVEVVSLIGDVAIDQGKPKIHAHVVVGKRDGSTAGGHLMEGHVRPTLEVVLTITPAYLQREFDAQSGIALIRV
jgi:uncharacterized protein